MADAAPTVKDYPVELVAPDIEDHRAGNTGIPFVTSFDSGRPGPHVMLNAVTHGNEICGAIAVDRLLREGIRPSAGRLSFAFVNYEAFLTFDPADAGASRFVDEDFNRVWLEERLDGEEDSQELRRARELRPWFDTVDRLLDIHSLGTYSEPLMICHGLDKERRFAERVGVPGYLMCGSGHVVGRRLIEYTPFNDTGNDKVALLVECGQHWAERTGRVAVDVAVRFLLAAGTVDEAVLRNLLSPEALSPPPMQVWQVTDGVTAETDDFRFAEPYIGMEVIPAAGTEIARDGERIIRTPHDDCLLMMPNHLPGAGMRKLRLCRRLG